MEEFGRYSLRVLLQCSPDAEPFTEISVVTITYDVMNSEPRADTPECRSTRRDRPKGDLERPDMRFSEHQAAPEDSAENDKPNPALLSGAPFT